MMVALMRRECASLHIPSRANLPIALGWPPGERARMDPFRAALRDYVAASIRAAGLKTPTELARAIEVAPSTLHRFMKDPETASLLRTDTLLKIHNLVGNKVTLPLPAATATLPQTISFDPGDEVVYAGRAYVPIGVYDVRVSAGPGSMNEDVSDPETFNLFRMEWLNRITNTPSDRLAVLRVAGDSMAMTLHHGDHVLVDRTIRRVERQAIYIVQDVDTSELQVKRCSRDPRTGLIDIKSDNPEYPSYQGVREDRFSVHGRVIWLGRNVGG